jgi:hypothetical protein
MRSWSVGTSGPRLLWSGSFRRFAPGRHGPAVAVQYGELLRMLIDSDRFPALHELVSAGTFDQNTEEYDADAEFEFGLERILDGVEALIRTRPGPREARGGATR